jgi:hypothetical protein
MRGDASRPVRGDGEGRNSPIVSSNGANSTSSPPPPPHPIAVDSSLYSPGINGVSSVSSPPHGRTSSFSYSSILASTAPVQSPGGEGGQSGNGASANHDKPFKYTRDEILNIWKTNATKYKSSGIPLEFEQHEAFTSEEPLEPALLTEMTLAEKEACSYSWNVLITGICRPYEFG